MSPEQGFLKLGMIPSVAPLMYAVRFSPLWVKDTISLREYKMGEQLGWLTLPQAHDIIFDLMRMIHGVRLGDVLIDRVPPGTSTKIPKASITRHEVVLQIGPGARMEAGEESMTPAAGEVWVWKIDGPAERINASPDDWISLLIEIETK